MPQPLESWERTIDTTGDTIIVDTPRETAEADTEGGGLLTPEQTPEREAENTANSDKSAEPTEANSSQTTDESRKISETELAGDLLPRTDHPSLPTHDSQTTTTTADSLPIEESTSQSGPTTVPKRRVERKPPTRLIIGDITSENI